MVTHGLCKITWGRGTPLAVLIYLIYLIYTLQWDFVLSAFLLLPPPP